MRRTTWWWLSQKGAPRLQDGDLVSGARREVSVYTSNLSEGCFLFLFGEKLPRGNHNHQNRLWATGAVSLSIFTGVPTRFDAQNFIVIFKI